MIDILINIMQFSIFLMLMVLIYYSKEKGKRIALREDIEEITDKIESVKSIYADRLTKLEYQHNHTINLLSRRNEIRVASLDRRLTAHQQAYALWWSLLKDIRDIEKIRETAFKCQEWWVENCLYLTPEARQAFNNAFHLAPRHQHLILAKEESSHDEASRQWNEIMRVGKILAAGVDLPEMDTPEYSPIEEIVKK